ncbi:MAG: cell envelope integrity protein TolA [Alphaproteobacteria bacterium]|nr:cell envelope integrity protein TolA [Alphaproteobacteria bacterium]
MSFHDENLKPALALSLFLHTLMLGGLYWGAPSFFNAPPLKEPWQPLPVDIVEIGAITNTRKVSEKVEEPPKKAPPPQPKEVKPPEPLKSEAIPPPPEKPAPPKPEPVKKPEPPKEDPLASVLKNVAKIKPAERPAPPAKQIAPEKQDGSAKSTDAARTGPAFSDRLTISQEDALRRQISACWNVPMGARDAHELVVEVLIEMNEDRTVRSAEVVDQFRFNADSHFRTAAEAAIRALRHPRCTPLELPPDRYDQWKTIRFTFDPRDMF